LVDREWRGRCIRMVAVPSRNCFGDLVNPLVELRCGAGVQRREAADDPRRALGDHQLRVRNNEHRCADHGDAQARQDRRQAQTFWYSRYQATKRGRPSSMRVVGVKPKSRSIALMSANVSLTSPGCIGWGSSKAFLPV